MRLKPTHNTLNKEVILFKGRKYQGVRDLYHNSGVTPAVGVATVCGRLRRRLLKKAHLTEEDYAECIELSADEYKRRFRVRKTWVSIENAKHDLRQLYEGLPEPAVKYATFRTRVKSVEKRFSLSFEKIKQAACSDYNTWSNLYGGGRRRKFDYLGDFYPNARGEYPSFTAFLKKIGRYEDRAYLKQRKKMKWDIDVALEEPAIPATDRLGRIYKIVQLSTGKVYVGLTINSLEQRYASHLTSANSKSSISPLHKALQEFGPDDFELEELEANLEINVLGRKEKYWISALNSVVPNGFNANRGGTIGGSRGKPIVIMGVKYPSRVEAANLLSLKLDLAPHVILTRLARGQILPKTARKMSRHPDAGTKFFRIWKSLINGVRNGTRSGPISSRWQNYDNWSADVLPSYIEEYQLVRIDDTKAWEIENFKWVTIQQKVERVHGKGYWIFNNYYPSKKSVSKKFNIAVSTFTYRVEKLGLSPEEAVSRELGLTSTKGLKFEFEGESYPSQTAAARILAKQHIISFDRARDRIRRNIPTERWSSM
ncbi:GIY-YIG nuclease family protein [Sneathiella litorea]|uniref:GIY-YIG domain-containing protein n=1 Tax=Sneathiella litorea TaxID=2606216 RepID=A0A6L8W8P2_9PROT|nr:GIY-YIG nuclease family protein [Sneathiella litorea]MZR31475.1 hypothetical protein [Sneathiella litorea]